MKLETFSYDDVGLGEGTVHVAIVQDTVIDDVAADFLMEQRCVWLHGPLLIDYRRKRFVVYPDEVTPVFCDVPVVRNDDGYGLPHISDLVDGRAEIF